jgi:hypothetical protein
LWYLLSYILSSIFSREYVSCVFYVQCCLCLIEIICVFVLFKVFLSHIVWCRTNLQKLYVKLSVGLRSFNYFDHWNYERFKTNLFVYLWCLYVLQWNGRRRFPFCFIVVFFILFWISIVCWTCLKLLKCVAYVGTSWSFIYTMITSWYQPSYEDTIICVYLVEAEVFHDVISSRKSFMELSTIHSDITWMPDIYTYLCVYIFYAVFVFIFFFFFYLFYIYFFFFLIF